MKIGLSSIAGSTLSHVATSSGSHPFAVARQYPRPAPRDLPMAISRNAICERWASSAVAIRLLVAAQRVLNLGEREQQMMPLQELLWFSSASDRYRLASSS